MLRQFKTITSQIKHAIVILVGSLSSFGMRKLLLSCRQKYGRKRKNSFNVFPEKLLELTHKGKSLELKTDKEEIIKADLVIDCTGRSNQLASMLKDKQYEFVKGDLSFYGGHWDDALDRFVVKARKLIDRNLACQLKGEEIYFLGTACPMQELICDDEAKNGSAKCKNNAPV